MLSAAEKKKQDRKSLFLDQLIPPQLRWGGGREADGGVIGNNDAVAHDPSVGVRGRHLPNFVGEGSATEWSAPSKDDHAIAPITANRKRHFTRSHQVAFCTMSAL